MTMAERIYFDYNATGIPKRGVIDAVAEAMSHVGNPSSVHGAGRAARLRVDDARASIAALINTSPQNIIFTGCGTEANNMALRGTAAASIIHSVIEHEATVEAATATGKPVYHVAVDAHGVVDMAALVKALATAPSPALVSIMLANNETGVIQPIADIAKAAHEFGALVHTDAIQAVSKIPVDFSALGVDMMSIAAHKMGGPQGIGALIVRPGIDVNAFLVGGGQERGRRSGTENVAGIVGFGVASELAQRDMDKYDHVRQLRDELQAKILACAPDAKAFGSGGERLPNTLSISMPGVPGDVQVMQFDLAGIALSSGSACSSGRVRESHVLNAMGAGQDGLNAIRISMGPDTNAGEVDRFFKAWQKIYQKKAGQAEMAKASAK